MKKILLMMLCLLSVRIAWAQEGSSPEITSETDIISETETISQSESETMSESVTEESAVREESIARDEPPADEQTSMEESTAPEAITEQAAPESELIAEEATPETLTERAPPEPETITEQARPEPSAEPVVEKSTETEIVSEPKPDREPEPPVPRSPLPVPNSPIAVGVGIEANNNSPHGVAYGGLIAADYRLYKHFALGIKSEFSSNFKTHNTFDVAALARFVWPFKGVDLFLQGGIGMSDIIFYEGNKVVFLWEGAAGVRVPLKKWYIEPSARYGSPFIWGAGIKFGRTF
jgi:hypothetical protein